MSEQPPSLWRAALGTIAGIGALGAVLVALWPTPRALALQAERPVVLTVPDAGPAPSQVPTSKPCGAPALPEKPAICFKRFHSAGELCGYACAPLATGDGWVALQLCRPEPVYLGDPEPGAKVLP